MSGIFISYRRKDTAAYARGLHDALSRAFGREQVFIDIRSLQRGLDFTEALAQAVESTDIVLSLIGPHWLTITDDADNRRLDDPDDHVRLEIATALSRKDIRVIPVLVGNASMPAVNALPADLKSLSRRNAIELTDERWEYDVGVLINDLKRVVKSPRAAWVAWVLRPLTLAATAGVLGLTLVLALVLNDLLRADRSDRDGDLNSSLTSTFDEVAVILSTVEPTHTPTVEPTNIPTVEPTDTPTVEPTDIPTVEPTHTPTVEPTDIPQSGADNTLGNVLISYDFERIPEAPISVRLLRITLVPGASVPMHTHPGIEFDMVESGALSVRTDGTAIVNADGALSEVSESHSLQPGSWIMYPPGVGMRLANEGNDNVVLLSAVLHPVLESASSTTYTEGDPTDADFEGVSFVVLGDGIIQQFPDSPSTVAIDTLTLAPGEPIPGYSGAALLSKESGNLAFTVDQGAVQVTRTAAAGLRPNATQGQEFTLNDNDAAFFPSGYERIERQDNQSELSLVRFLILPQGELDSPGAVVTSVETEDTAAAEESGGGSPEQDMEVAEAALAALRVWPSGAKTPSVPTLITHESDALIWLQVRVFSPRSDAWPLARN